MAKVALIEEGTCLTRARWVVSGEEWPAAFVFGSFRAESPTQSRGPCLLPSPPPPEPELLLLHSRFRQHLHTKAENSEGARESGGVGVPHSGHRVASLQDREPDAGQGRA